MIIKYSFKPQSVCSRQIDLDIEEGIIKDISFIGGCSGNLKGIASLACGRSITEVIPLLSGIACGFKNTSCPDQLAQALCSIRDQQPKADQKERDSSVKSQEEISGEINSD